MLDIFKAAIEFLSWPLVALVLGLVFRKPLVELVLGIVEIKTPGLHIQRSLASAQNEPKQTPRPEAWQEGISSPTSEPPHAPGVAAHELAASSEERRKSILTFGRGIAIVDEGVAAIKAELTALNFPLGAEETADTLVRHLATTQLMLRCERTHRLIYGSQIVALHLLKNGGYQPEKTLRSIFEDARAREPLFYGSYVFTEWAAFLIREGAVGTTEDGLYAITVYGNSYLDYAGMFSLGPKPH